MEYRRIVDQTAVWLIPLSDEPRRRLLYKSPRNARILFSPDEEWLLISNSPNGNGNGAQLYRRAGTDDSLYEVPENFQRPGSCIDDLAWGFYPAEVGLPPGASRNHVRIEGTDWQEDSSAFTLRFVSFGPGGVRHRPCTVGMSLQAGGATVRGGHRHP